MEHKRIDVRLSSVLTRGRTEEEPQCRYSGLAAERSSRADGIVNLFSMRDIIAVNRHPAVLGQGGGGYSMGNSRPLVPLEVDGPEHTTWRRLLDPLFGPKKVALLDGVIREQANALIDGFVGDGEVEFFEGFCQPLPSLVFLGLLGAPTADLPFFVDFKNGVIHPAGDTMEEMGANAAVAGAKMYEYFDELVRQRRAAGPGSDDLIGSLMQAEVDGAPLPDDKLIDILYLLMFAGLDTVTASLSCIVSWLARHPAERQTLVDDPAVLRTAIEEILRFESPVPSGSRYATEDIDLGDGLVVRKGEQMHAMWAAANVDPAAFDDPLRVDFSRPRNTHIVFASGRHRCLGSHLARLELRVALEEFHRRIPQYWIAEGDGASYDNVSVRTVHRLPLRFRRA